MRTKGCNISCWKSMEFLKNSNRVLQRYLSLLLICINQTTIVHFRFSCVYTDVCHPQTTWRNLKSFIDTKAVVMKEVSLILKFSRFLSISILSQLNFKTNIRPTKKLVAWYYTYLHGTGGVLSRCEVQAVDNDSMRDNFALLFFKYM